MTGSKSLTDLADLPMPVKQNKRQVVSAWNDDDWNFDDIETSNKKAEKKERKPKSQKKPMGDDLGHVMK